MPVVAVAAAVAGVGAGGEVHRHHPAVDGYHAVLRSGADPQLDGLRLQDDVGLLGPGDVRLGQLVELHQGAEHRRDDRRGSAQPHPEGDVAVILDGTVAPRQRDAAFAAVVVEAHQEGLDQANPAVVAKLAPAADERRHVVEAGGVTRVRQHRQAFRLVQRDTGGERVEQQGDHLAAEQVGRVADESGPRAGGAADGRRRSKSRRQHVVVQVSNAERSP